MPPTSRLRQKWNGLLAACCDSPADDTARLVLADWLEENGDESERARAEFIRVQVEHARAGDFDPRSDEWRERERELLVTYETDWVADLPGWARRRVTFRRGLPGTVGCSVAQFLKQGAALRTVTPIEAVRLDEVSGALDDLTVSAELAGIPELSLSGEATYPPGGLETLLASESLAGVKRLALVRFDLQASQLRTLLRCPLFDSLTTLDLGLNRLGDEGLRALAKKSFRAGLTELDLRSNGIRDIGSILASGLSMDCLERLCLDANDLGDPGIAWLAASPRLGSLRELGLDSNDIGLVGLLALSRAVFWGRLVSLDLSSNNVGPEGVEAFAEFEGESSLKRLDLCGCGVGSGMIRLAESPMLRGLRRLGLFDNQIDSAGVIALVRSPHMPELFTLTLAMNDLDDDAARALAECPRLGKLRELYLWSNRIGPAGAAALANSPNLPSLQILHLGGNRLGDEGARALANGSGLSQLRLLTVNSNRIKKPGEDALRERFGAAVKFREDHGQYDWSL